MHDICLKENENDTELMWNKIFFSSDYDPLNDDEDSLNIEGSYLNFKSIDLTSTEKSIILEEIGRAHV